MRGEYSANSTVSSCPEETSPHARRIQASRVVETDNERNISACAENTACFPCAVLLWRKHLRMRGEYNGGSKRGIVGMETSPHARRILNFRKIIIVRTRNISACAENTFPDDIDSTDWRKNLRMRGEYFVQLFSRILVLETSPHARRIPYDCLSDSSPSGNISACAENTSCCNFF